MFNIGGSNSNIMQELIDRLKSDVGLTDAQAQQTLTVIKDFAKQKFPMFSGSIDSAFNKYSPKQDDDFLD
jgi:hypothetical protein